jgi:guanylate kinase
MSNKPIFCIVGKTGSGKSYYLDLLLSDSRISNNDITRLTYHTTRDMRSDKEINEYRFSSYKDFEDDIARGNVIEYREYTKLNNKVVYYTTNDDIKYPIGYNSDEDINAYICAASIDQVLAYNDKLDNIYMINIDSNIHTRMTRLLDRANNDNDCYEICRRILEEDNEYNKIKLLNMNPDRYISIDNNIHDYNDQWVKSNISIIIDFINSHLK